MKHYTVHFQPDNLSTSIHEGATLLEAAGQVGLILSTPCGGRGRCRKCAVHLLPSQKEVLACQYLIKHDLTVSIPNSSRFFEQKILEHGIHRKIDGVPSIRKVFLENPPSNIDTLCEVLSDNLSSETVVQNSLTIPPVQLSACLQNGVTAVLLLNECDQQSSSICYQLTDIEPGNTSKTLYGVAVDIGTTTVVVRLVDLNTAETIATESTGNPQGQYGADVISRISYSENKSGMETLHKTIITCLNELILSACQKAGIKLNDIYEMTAVGNTTMNHLLLNYPVQQLGQAPYEAYSLEAKDLRPQELKININSSGNIHTLANIAGFVGSDTVAATLACGLDITEAHTLLVDIGTNGEIVFGTQSHLLAASCAAGPALEGAGITFGSRAQSGAIERVVLNENDIDIDVIGDAQASTICGSGLIDAVAAMLDLGIIESTGRFCDSDELNPLLPSLIRKRLITHNNEPAFVLAGHYTENQWEQAVLLTQKDIRQMQLANAAIRAGIELLLKKSGTNSDDIQQLLLAGAFGNYIQKKSAVRIGLLPKIPLEKIHFVGNAAGSGARMALISRNARLMAKKIASKIEYLEIAHQADFQMVFGEFLIFPEK